MSHQIKKEYDHEPQTVVSKQIQFLVSPNQVAG